MGLKMTNLNIPSPGCMAAGAINDTIELANELFAKSYCDLQDAARKSAANATGRPLIQYQRDEAYAQGVKDAIRILMEHLNTDSSSLRQFFADGGVEPVKPMTIGGI